MTFAYQLRLPQPAMRRYEIDPARIKFSDSAVRGRGRSCDVVFGKLFPPPTTQDSSQKVKLVAVKKFRSDDDTDADRFQEYFIRELKVLRKVSHPHVVKFIGFVEDFANGKAWIVFPWESHGNVREFLKTGHWEIPERISLISDTSAGLKYLHGLNPPICHGDLKSLNILVNGQYRAVIADFGSARFARDSTASSFNSPRSPSMKLPPPSPILPESSPSFFQSPGPQFLTMSSMSQQTSAGFGGTIRWASPEVLSGFKGSLPSDLWSLGWVAWEIMTDKLPHHEADNDLSVVLNVLEGRIAHFGGDKHMAQMKTLCDLVLNCWTVDPKQRPTASDFSVSISLMPQCIPSPSAPTSPGTPRTRSASLLYTLGRVHEKESRFEDAETLYRESLDLARTTGDDRMAEEAKLAMRRASRTGSQEMSTQEKREEQWKKEEKETKDQRHNRGTYQKMHGRKSKGKRKYQAGIKSRDRGGWREDGDSEFEPLGEVAPEEGPEEEHEE
ncbi:hypothetical protein FRC04_004641 [Tulasnella sp. 424]|nr:hypothetical protein FRC04_004641 [Tulasnella sp. 424]